MESPPSRVKEESLIREGAQPAPEEDDAKPELELVGRGAPEVQPEVDARSSSADLQDLGVPPPPPSKPSGDLDHVDVDLGPLKSVSRNHARIEYRSDLGRFCLEIYGRNGAWVDDRYYVRGSVVPLYQG
jgi:hypothetical protein